MNALRKFFGSTIGQKIVMAVTGAVLALFVLAHMAGNLQAFLPNGPEALDHYGAFLRTLLHGTGIWFARAGLLIAVALHVWAFVALLRKNRAARPVGYKETAAHESTWASRSMKFTGPLLLVFVVYHLMHFTIGNVHPQFEEGHVYHNLITGLQVVPVAIFYLVAMAALAFHLFHGTWSMLQTLGASHPTFDLFRKRLAAVFTVLVCVGFAIVPIAVLMGWLR